MNELVDELKSPPFEGGASAPAKRERDSAKHQEKAQTGVVSSGYDHLNHPACSLGSQASPPSKGGDFNQQGEDFQP